MIRTLKTAALALMLPGVIAIAVPAQAAVVNGASHVMLPGEKGGNGDTWNHGRRGHGDRDRNYSSYSGGSSNYDNDRRYEDRRYEDRRYDDRRYDDNRYDNRYDNRVYRDTRVWRGNDGRAYCSRRDGTTGLLIGGAAGALLGREVAGYRGDRTLGAILGAAGGALIGREIDRGGSQCR